MMSWQILDKYTIISLICFPSKWNSHYIWILLEEIHSHKSKQHQYCVSIIMTYYHISIHLFQFFNCLHTIILLVTIIIHLQNQLMSLWYVLPRNKSTAKNSHFVKICIPVWCLWHCAQSGNTYIFYLAVRISMQF
jgi:hypothetical protein